jgi:hypothetical protein
MYHQEVRQIQKFVPVERIVEFARLWDLIQLTDQDDWITWKWIASGEFATKSHTWHNSKDHTAPSTHPQSGDHTQEEKTHKSAETAVHFCLCSMSIFVKEFWLGMMSLWAGNTA